MNYRIQAEAGTASYIQSIVSHMTLFCCWLGSIGVNSWRNLERQNLLDFLTYLRKISMPDGKTYSEKYLGAIVSHISVFIEEASMNEWADISRSVRWLRHERPRPQKNDPQLMGQQNAARLRHPDNLKLIEDPDFRMAINIIAETGLRRRDVVYGISMNCLIDVGNDKWSLRYMNTKGAEPLSIPISPQLAGTIGEFIQHKRARFPHATKLFVRKDPDRVLTLTLVNNALKDYVELLDLRDSAGDLVSVTPHMFRHQNATDWLEQGVPMPVIQKLLGHKSLSTTEIYARMSEKKVREEWEKMRAVNRTGDLVDFPMSDLEEAAWTHAFMGGASQALPNGRCGMPCNETCEHANACLTCPLFMTTPEYLPVLREQREEHRQMIELAEREGYQRIVEKNTKPFEALTHLIDKLETLEEPRPAGVG
ncbi:tyrosine-type recombinase/integrase [Arthrobacter sp. USHLN218]|uniref:tyrosine-type recombinase/integrase n=1 Tax=Arthrobacter sp. USHLN218 TaxID=3081232 RepID=UPI00301714CA